MHAHLKQEPSQLTPLEADLEPSTEVHQVAALAVLAGIIPDVLILVAEDCHFKTMYATLMCLWGKKTTLDLSPLESTHGSLGCPYSSQGYPPNDSVLRHLHSALEQPHGPLGCPGNGS